MSVVAISLPPTLACKVSDKNDILHKVQEVSDALRPFLEHEDAYLYFLAAAGALRCAICASLSPDRDVYAEALMTDIIRMLIATPVQRVPVAAAKETLQ